ncbi:MAG: hypothetical protein QOD62_2207, partial [Actinomycetota bacterium]|nr:hypothetical protein [Actinomycetota bacterium]
MPSGLKDTTKTGPMVPVRAWPMGWPVETSHR